MFYYTSPKEFHMTKGVFKLMTYQEFKNNILRTISVELGPTYRISIQDIIKNNDTHLDGLTILSENSNISPTIYLNYYYEQFLSNHSFSSVVEDILDSYHQNAPKENIDIRFFTDFDNVKNRIIFKLVNYDRNRELLTKVPHIKYLDLALVFNCFIESTPQNCATILIHYHHLTFWNISAEELYRLALKNTPELLPYQIQNMTEIVSDLFHDNFSELFNQTFCTSPMYVLSNITKLNGSGCILYEDLLSDIAEKIGSDFYIIPSSVHEVLLIPTSYATSYDELCSMVKEINASQLTREEVLSDSVYYYSRILGKITM